MSYTLVQSDEGLAEVLGDLEGAPAVAVDTEFMRRNTYYPQVALLQLCARDHAWLIDPLAISELAGLRAFLTNPQQLKVLHSPSEDLEVFRRWLGVLPEPMVDTQRAMALLGGTFGLGYRALVEELLGISLEKGETRSDWLRRPLTESQLHYAAQDVLQLVPAWAELVSRAENQGRMSWVLEESRAAVQALEEREQQGWRRIKSAGKLSRRSLGALRALYQWREERAQKVDKPRGWVLEDKACVALAKHLPQGLDDLAKLELLPSAVLRRQGEALLACIDSARESDETQLPQAPPKPLDSSQRQDLKALRAGVQAQAQTLGVAPEILLTGADLELLMRERAGEAITLPERWQGWRRDAVLAGLRSQHAVQPQEAVSIEADAGPRTSDRPDEDLLVEVFRSPKKEGMYLYVPRADGCKNLPEPLTELFGSPESVLVLKLHGERKLARANAREVLQHIETQGYYLQMPPSIESAVKEKNIAH